MPTFYRMHHRGAHSSHLKLTADAAAVIRLSEIIDELVAGVEGEVLDADPTDPVITSITVTPRGGGAITFSTRATLVDPNLGEVDALDDAIVDLDTGLDSYGQEVEGSLTISPGTRTNLRAWAWKAEAATVVDVNISWTDVAGL